MNFIWKNALKGLAAVLPVTLTIYLVYWLGVYLEQALHPVITLIVPERFYQPGLGLVAGLILLFFIGLAVNAWVVQRLFRLVEALLEQIPLVKSIYGSLHDFMSYFSSAEQRGGLKQVVLVSFGEAKLIGFLTRENVADIPGLESGEEIVAVYLPLSYQIGGYTVYLPRTQVTPLDIGMEEAMRRVLTAELSKSGGNGKH